LQQLGAYRTLGTTLNARWSELFVQGHRRDDEVRNLLAADPQLCRDLQARADEIAQFFHPRSPRFVSRVLTLVPHWRALVAEALRQARSQARAVRSMLVCFTGEPLPHNSKCHGWLGRPGKYPFEHLDPTSDLLCFESGSLSRQFLFQSELNVLVPGREPVWTATSGCAFVNANDLLDPAVFDCLLASLGQVGPIVAAYVGLCARACCRDGYRYIFHGFSGPRRQQDHQDTHDHLHQAADLSSDQQSKKQDAQTRKKRKEAG
jgi:hypothetical protein